MTSARARAAAAAAVAAPCLTAMVLAAPAHAQTITVTTTPPNNAPELGRVVVVGGTTSFSIDASTGTVTRLAGGTAIRMSNAGTTAPTVSITCSNSALCATMPMQVTVTAVGGAGSAAFSQFSVANLTNTTFVGGAPAPSPSLTFTIAPIANRTASFSLGTRVTVSGGAAPGDHSFSYVVNASIL